MSLTGPFERRSQAAELLAARPPELTIDADGSYRQALAPGWYLLSVRPTAVELNVHEDETLTVNVLRRDGPTGFFTGRHGEVR